MHDQWSEQSAFGRKRIRKSNRASLFPRFCFCGFARNQQLLSDLQFARVLDLIERKQIVIRNFQFLCDRHRIITSYYSINFSRARGLFHLFG